MDDAKYPSVEGAKTLVAELCAHFYSQGWVSGTGGGISVRAKGGRIVMAPSGVQKERMHADDMFVLDEAGAVVETPRSGCSTKLSECAPLFLAAYQLRGAGAVIHSHAVEALLATLLPARDGGGAGATEFACTQLEMQKGIQGHGFYDTLEVPIIENTARESELTFALRQAMGAFPKTSAVLVRRHGVYIWGDTWQQAKTQAECYHYLFSAVVEAAKMGIRLDVGPGKDAALATYSNGAARWRPGDAQQ